MADKGFAIRCPHCGSWYINDEDDLRELSVNDTQELLGIMTDFEEAQKKRQSYAFKHKKMFRCTQPRWSCPASFEGFIFREEQTALDSLDSLKEIRAKWDISRDFRLYKKDRINRWDKQGENNYYCIMFGTEAVPRLQHIELEHLLNADIASNLITAICKKVHAPITVYSANVMTCTAGDDIYWMPIEDYFDEIALIPSRYNVFCATCRQITIEALKKEFIDEFKAKKEQYQEEINSQGELTLSEEQHDRFNGFGFADIKPECCYFENPTTDSRYWDSITGKCAGREPICRGIGLHNQKEPGDLNHCPAFIDKRRKKCPCYKADMELIKEVIRKFKQGICDVICPNPSHCPASFIETGITIKVHEHLIGVAMLGQMYEEAKDISKIETFRERVNNLTPESPLLRLWAENETISEQFVQAREVLLWSEKQFDERTTELRIGQPDLHVRFKVDKEEMAKRSKYLKTIAYRIEKIAEARYRDIRSRSEYAFRNEMMGYIEHTMMRQLKNRDPRFFNGSDAPITYILERMREFWAFEALVYGWWSLKDLFVRMVAYSTSKDGKKSGEGFGFPGQKMISNMHTYKKVQDHPIAWLYDPSKETGPPRDDVVKHIFGHIRTAESFFKVKGIPTNSTTMLFIVVPFVGNIYSLVFLSRDESRLSATCQKKSRPVSEMCKEFMLRTCTETIYELCDVRFREEQRDMGNGARSQRRIEDISDSKGGKKREGKRTGEEV